MRRRLFILGVLLLFLSACGAGQPAASFAPAEEERLVVYTSHEETVYGPIIKEFEDRTGIWVQVENGGTGELLDRIAAEAESPSCDLLFGGGADTLRSRPELFEPYVSPLTREVLPAFRCPDGTWTAFSSLPVVLIYNPMLIRSNPPDSWQSLLDPAWRGKIAFASPAVSGSSYTALAALLPPQADFRCPAQCFPSLPDPARFRLLPYRSVGVDSGLLLAVRVDALEVDGKPCPNRLIALSPTPVSDTGAYQALLFEE